MSIQQFDLIVLGTGPSASTVAKKLANQGKRVAVVESREFGGTCALRGCNPKKVYTNAADLIDRVRAARGKLMECDGARIDWPQLLEFKREFTQPVIEGSEESFRKQGIATFHGKAAFIGPLTVRVGEDELTAERLFVGVGAHPRTLDIPGGDKATTSDRFLDRQEIPERVVFVGGGYISMEFACAVARYGSRVTVLQSGDQLLPEFDPDLVAQLVEYSKSHGVDVRTNAKVGEITGGEGRPLVAHYGDTEQNRQTVEADLVVHGAGRVPHLEGLNLEAANVDFGEEGIEVDAFMRSVSNRSVFAGGDCAATGQPRLTPTANEEARAAVKNLFADQPTHRPDYGAIPQVAFTVPPIASIGMSHQDLEDVDKVEIHHEDTSSWNSVRKTCQLCAGHKILIDKQNGQILGAHLLGPAADETINLFALAMKCGLSAKEIKSTLFAFPTHASDVREML